MNEFHANTTTTQIGGVATFVRGDHGPRGQMSKGQLSKEILVRGDFLSKEAFTSDKLAQIISFYSLLDVTILIDYKMTKKIM